MGGTDRTVAQSFRCFNFSVLTLIAIDDLMGSTYSSEDDLVLITVDVSRIGFRTPPGCSTLVASELSVYSASQLIVRDSALEITQKAPGPFHSSQSGCVGFRVARPAHRPVARTTHSESSLFGSRLIGLTGRTLLTSSVFVAPSLESECSKEVGQIIQLYVVSHCRSAFEIISVARPAK